MMTAAEESLPILIENTRHRFPATRLRAVKAIGKYGDGATSALTALTLSLDDADGKVREAAAASIGQVGPLSVSILAQMLSHPDKYVRRHSVWGLGKLVPHSVPYRHKLCHALKDEDPRTASGAAQALGAMGELGAEAVAPLTEAMRGTNIVLCRLAAKALSQIGRPSLPTLIAHLRHNDPFVRGEAAVALGWMGPLATSAVPMLVDVLRAPTPTTKTVASVSSPGLAGTPPTGVTAKPGDPPSSVDAARVNAAQALGRIGPNAAASLNALQDALRDPSDAVRAAADLSIKQIHGLV